MGDKDIPVWPFKELIGKQSMKAFFRFIQRIDSVKICFFVDDCGWFLEHYYQYHDSLTKRGQSNPVRVTLSNENPFDSDHVQANRPEEYYPVYVTLEDANSDITLEFRDAISKTDAREHIITKKNSFVTVLDLDMKFNTGDIIEDLGQCIKNIMQYQPNLECLKFYYGSLQLYEIEKRVHKIRDVEFANVFLFDGALTDTMKDFPYLKQLTFDRCIFETSHLPLQRFNLHMRSTDIGHLQVVYEKSPLEISSVLFKITQDDTESDIRYFQAFSENTKLLQEINHATVFGDDNLSTCFDIAVFNIHCKSIQHLTFRRHRLPYQEQDQAVASFST